jgi:release factor glutamine methyltransferase
MAKYADSPNDTSDLDNIAKALQHALNSGLARLDAQHLLLHTLGRPLTDRAWLTSHAHDTLTQETAQCFSALCTRLSQGEPLAYLLGQQEFFGLTLAVDPRVLIPRSDTETLVNWALTLLPTAPGSAKVLDLGTGSGAVALALKYARPSSAVLAIDASEPALCVARANALSLGLDVRMMASCWLAGVSGVFDLIVSNPPYVRAGDPHLAALGHEPFQALTAGADGLDDLRQIIAQAPPHLAPGGWLLLEHGYDQAGAVSLLLQEGGFEEVSSRPDLAGILRCTGGRWSAGGKGTERAG